MKLLTGKPFLLLIGLLLGIGGGFGAGQMFGGNLPFLPAKPAATASAAAPPKEGRGGIMLPTRERIVNLADPGLMRYLKTTIILEVSDPAAQSGELKGDDYKKRQDELTKELRGQMPLVDDQITAILSAKTSNELLTPEGKERLKEEIKSRLSGLLGEHKVLGVYLADFIIQ